MTLKDSVRDSVWESVRDVWSAANGHIVYAYIDCTPQEYTRTFVQMPVYNSVYNSTYHAIYTHLNFFVTLV
jgi:hypothetical protein